MFFIEFRFKLILTWVFFDPGSESGHSPVEHANDKVKRGIGGSAGLEDVGRDHVHLVNSGLYHRKSN